MPPSAEKAKTTGGTNINAMYNEEEKREKTLLLLLFRRADDDDYTFEYLDVFTLNMNTHALKYICIYTCVCVVQTNALSLSLSHMAFPNCIFLLNIKLVLCIKPSMMPTTLYTPPTMAINVVMNW